MKKKSTKNLETTIQVYPNNSVVDNAKTFPFDACATPLLLLLPLLPQEVNLRD